MTEPETVQPMTVEELREWLAYSGSLYHDIDQLIALIRAEERQAARPLVEALENLMNAPIVELGTIDTDDFYVMRELKRSVGIVAAYRKHLEG